MKRPGSSHEATSAQPDVKGRSAARRLPSLDSLRAFEVVARRLSFTDAAQELCVTQSAVSQRIKSLEQELGAVLFERTPRGLRLSRTGARLAHGVREGLVYFASAVAEAHEEALTGAVDITALPSFSSLWLLPRLPEFSHSHSEIEIRLHVDVEVVDLLASNLDAAIRYGDGQYPGLVVKRLMGDAVVPACSPAMLERYGPVREVADLARLPLLHDTQTETDRSGSGWPAWLTNVGHSHLRFTAGMRIGSANLVVDAAVRGLGVALVRLSLAEDEFASERLVRAWPEATSTAFSYFFICRRDALSNVRLRVFRDWLAAECEHAERARTDV
jgi:LysR family glycine cleavage system transcriptional activator